MTTADLADSVPDGVPVVVPDDPEWGTGLLPRGDLGLVNHPDALAWLIYTSGSSGRPKGVGGTHRGLLNRLRWARRSDPWEAGERASHRTSPGFVDGVAEVLEPLLSGVPVDVVDAATAADPRTLVAEWQRCGTTRVLLVPSLLRVVLDGLPMLGERLPALRRCTVSGESLPRDLVDRFRAAAPGASLRNLYGSTEVAADVTAACLDDPECRRAGGRIPIGTAIDGVVVEACDERGDVLEPMLVGEFCVAGECLSRGYHGRPGETAERFRPGPAGTRVFRTGDRGARRADGAFEHLGRMDAQIKVRGVRVEPDAVQDALRDDPAVADSAVAAWTDADGMSALAGYVVLRAPSPVARILDRVRSVLPAGHVPSTLDVLPTLPRTSSGKLDRHRLPRPGSGRPDPFPETPVGPTTGTERTVADVFAELLPVTWSSVNDDFFGLGGHSMLAAAAVDRLSTRCRVPVELRDLFDAPTIAGLADTIAVRTATGPAADLDPTSGPALVPRPKEHHLPFPLTEVQQAYWIGRDPSIALGNVATHAYFEVDGDALHPERLTAAVRRLVERHHALRTVVLPDGRQQVLWVVPSWRLPVSDLRAARPADVRGRLAAIRDEMSHQVLPADRWPLFDLRLSLVPGGRSRLHVSIDALVADAYSVHLLMSELAERYRDPVRDRPTVDLTFRDVVVAGAERGSTGRQRALEYWRRRAPGLPPGPDLPLVRAPGSVDRPRFRRLSARLPAVDRDRLAARAVACGVTRTGVLLAAFCEVLSAWSERRHYSVTLTLFNRLGDHPQLGQVIGDFTSLIPVEIDHREPGSLRSRARDIQARMWADLDHRAAGTITVLREQARSRGRAAYLTAPIAFTSTLDLEPDLGPALAGPATEPLGSLGYAVSQTPQLILDHQVGESPDGIELSWDVVDELFPGGVVDEMFAAYLDLLRAATGGASVWDAPVRDLLPSHQRRGRELVNTTEPTAADGVCLHTLVERAAVQAPERPAVVTPSRELSYRELSRSAARVAQRLREEGIGRGRLVGVAMEKGWEQVVAVVGITAAGAAYVPLDPDLPADRMRRLVRATGVTHVLVESGPFGGVEGLAGVSRLAVDDDTAWPDDGRALHELPDYGIDERDLAYVIHTSGSTGVPKGVMVDHRGAVNTVLDVAARFRVASGDRVLGLSSLSFDLSVFDVFGTLAAGATLVLPSPGRRRDPRHWIDLVADHRVTVWNSVPALAALAVEQAERAGGALGSVRLFLLSGDWIPLTLPRRLRAAAGGGEVEVVSMGGATEASIWSVAYHPVRDEEPGWASIPYGRPLAGQSMHVLDRSLEPVPDWVVGDLYIGGAGLALGYWRDPERTAAQFPIHPRTGERLYRTGDLARYRGSDLELIGRSDLQVKVNGHRVELGEIEAALGSIQGVTACAAAAAGPRTERRLVACYVTDDPARTVADVRSRLTETLPAYLVPSTITIVPELPLGANGKLDRAAVEAVTGTGATPVSTTVGVPAPPDLVRSVCRVWAEVLGVDHVGPNDNFFQLGGTSLVAVRLLARLRELLRVELPLLGLLQSPTAAELARAISDVGESAAGAPPRLTPRPQDRYQPFGLTDVQQAYWLGRSGGLRLGNVATHSYTELDVADLDLDRLAMAVRRLVDRHEALRTVVSADGTQRVLPDVEPYRIERRDVRGLSPERSGAELDHIRRTLSHRVRDPAIWPLFEVSATRVSDRITRLHVGVDLLISDAHSHLVLQRELLACYASPDAEPVPLGCTFRDYVVAVEGLRGDPGRRRAERYWRERVPDMPSGPDLPLDRDPASITTPRFERLQARLDRGRWSRLRSAAASADLTPPGLLCAGFAEVLALWSQRGRFLVNLTTFNRLPLHPDVDRLVGDFTSTTLLAVDATAPTFAERAARLQAQIFADLEHRAVSGIEVLRMMRRDPRHRPDASAPVVFTSTLLPQPVTGPEPAPPTWDAEPVYAVSQTSQVLLDHQVSEHAGELVSTWDFVAEAFPSGMIDAMFDAYGRQLRSLADDGDYWKAAPAWPR